MRTATVFISAVLLLGLEAGWGAAGEGDVNGAAVEPPVPPRARFVWLAGDGTERWSIPLDCPAHPAGESSPERGTPLHAPPWFPGLPALDVERIDADGPTSLREFAGSVLLIHFWASWCEPCAEELPWLQRLYGEERDRGLAVLTVNMNETDEIARRFVESLGCDLPIARYTPALDGAFGVRSLPAMLVVDRRQRIRERIDGYAAGIEGLVESLVRRLLEEVPRPGPEIARVRHGGGRLAVAWSRLAAARVEGITVLPATGRGGEGGVVAACGRTLETYGPAGRSIRTDSVVSGIDRVRSSGDPRNVLGFRPGGRRVLPLVFGGEVGESWEAPVPTLDLLVERSPARTPATALLATTDGLHRAGLDGSALAAREDLGVVLAIGAGARGLVALSAGGRLTWLDEDLEVLRTGTAPSGTRVLAASPLLGEGLGLGPESVISITAGRLGADGGARLALAVADRLSIVDPDTGREGFRADWPGIRALAAGDLDGDGREELVVGSDRRVTVLRSTAVDSEVSP